MSLSRPTSILTPNAAQRQLDHLQLTPELLRLPIIHGYDAAASCSSHAPRSYPGQRLWGEGTIKLRDLLAPQGWIVDRTGNLEAVVSRDGTRALIIMSGNSSVGGPAGILRTRNPHGAATSEVVSNNAPWDLFNQPASQEEADAQARLAQAVTRQTWLLLHHWDRTKEEVRMELALPLVMEGKTITRWSARIPLEPHRAHLPADIDLEDDVIDVEIDRKAN